MKLRTTSVLLLAFITIIILTSTEVDGIKCCVRVSKNIPKRMLRSFSRVQIQDKSGPCDIDAVLLFIKHKKICADPAVLKHVQRLMKLRKLKKAKAKTK